jgi:DNA-binding GntR family transcriptional regulator
MSSIQFSKKSLRKELADRLFLAILEGDLKPGEQLGEVRLARQLGVGQSTLREALQELEHRGVLTKRNRNTFVTLITPEKVEEIYTVRLALEPVAAALAAVRMSPERIATLLCHLDDMRAAIARGDTVAMVNADLAFHESVWKFSGNEYLERSLGLVCPPLFAFYLVNFRSSDRLPADLLADANEHTELIQALETGDPARARQAFEETLQVFRRRHLQHVASIAS